MRVLRKYKLLYLHGYKEESKFPEGGVVYQELKKVYDIDFLDYSSDPKVGFEQFMRLDLSKYDLIVGLSMGAVYASIQTEVPTILINPGFGISNKWPEFRYVDDLTMTTPHGNIKLIMLGELDSHRDIFEDQIRIRGLLNKVKYFPSEHVPTPLQIHKYIIPEINSLLAFLCIIK